jgi:thioredoxin reductase (NADPH)
MGTSGAALMARAYNQAHKFGVEIAIPDEVTSLETADDPAVDSFLLRLANGEVVRTRTVVIASGARYRRLAVDKLEEFESSSIRYWCRLWRQSFVKGKR